MDILWNLIYIRLYFAKSSCNKKDINRINIYCLHVLRHFSVISTQLFDANTRFWSVFVVNACATAQMKIFTFALLLTSCASSLVATISTSDANLPVNYVCGKKRFYR